MIEAKKWICCSVGKPADGKPLPDFVHVSYLCTMWSGREGASVTREGAALDKLPEEVFRHVFQRETSQIGPRRTSHDHPHRPLCRCALRSRKPRQYHELPVVEVPAALASFMDCAACTGFCTGLRSR